MTSMIDVVFLLLIFFLTSSTFLQPERQLDTLLGNPQGDTQSESNLEPLLVSLQRQNDRVVYQVGARQTSKEIEIRKILEGIRVKQAGVVVVASSGIPFEKVVDMLSICRESGFEKVTYAPGIF